MNAFKSYFHPGSKKGDDKKPVTSNVEMKASPMGSRTPGLSSKTTPAGTTPAASRPVSRPGSIYPSGDFRNAAVDEIADIKADVMVNWLYQQQMERLWTTGDRGEGVLLKKKRAEYTCCPQELQQDYAGLFDAVVKLNVRVGHPSISFVFLKRLTWLVCHDREYKTYQSFPSTGGRFLRSSSGWLTTPNSSEYYIPTPVSKASFRRLYSRLRHACGMG